MNIKIVQVGLNEEKEPKTYTGNEFINEYGTALYDEVRDIFCEFHEDERDENGHIRFWAYAYLVEVWED